MAGSTQEREEQLREFELLLDLLKKNPKLLNFFSSSQISKDEKEQVLKKSLSGQFSPNVLRSLYFLIEKGRFIYLPQIIKEYRRKVIEELGVIEARLITPMAVQQATKEKLKGKLENAYKKKIALTEEIDPELVGGGILFIANRMLDFSVKGKLDRLKEDLLTVNI